MSQKDHQHQSERDPIPNGTDSELDGKKKMRPNRMGKTECNTRNVVLLH